MSGRIFSLMLAFVCFVARPAETNNSSGAVLQLFDGSILHGAVSHIEAGKGVEWRHPAAADPLQFTITNIARIRFEQPVQVVASEKPSCRFKFFNGDEITGSLDWMTGDKAGVETWFAGKLEASRQALQSVEFSKRGFRLIYEGPTSIDGWITGRNPRSWKYQDGAFVANGADILGRDFKLNTSSILEFDLAWSASFSLSLTTYTSSIDRFDYNASAYMYYLSPGSVAVQRIQAGAGVALLGQTVIPAMARKNHAHMEFRSSKEEAALTLLVDGAVVQRWHDPAGFVAKGGGVVFFSQVDGPSLRLSNIRISEWDGRSVVERGTNAPPDADLVFLGNKDKVIGKIQEIKDGKLEVLAGETTLKIPLPRVTQIFFSNTATAPEPEQPWQVRAFFAGGEKVAFNLNAVDRNLFRGRSRNFGDVQFDTRSVRQLQFNLGRSPAALEAATLSDDDLLEGDE